jgi:hypothetical protein
MPSHAGAVLLSHAGTVLPSHAGCGKITQPPRSEHRGVVASQRSRIFVLACSRVIARKYHSLGTSPNGKNLTLLSVSNNDFAHMLAMT